MRTRRQALSIPDLGRGLLGGMLMGLANLVPGISGGTMLLAVGVYPEFIQGVADASMLRLRSRNVAILASIGTSAALAIVLLAGPMKGLVIGYRWAMFSLFIGLTLGGIPVVWRLLRPLNSSAVMGCAVGVLLMAVMAFAAPATDPGGSGDPQYLLLFLAGVAGASAMILPGVSGGYLLLVLGQYLAILGAVDEVKAALLSAAGDSRWTALQAPLQVFVPVGLGVVVGVVGISNLLRFLLARYEKPTLGLLLGLLLGAVLGLWPFQEGVPPQPGDVIRGEVMNSEAIAELDPEDFPLQRFSPNGGQVLGALGLALLGFGITLGVARVGGRSKGIGEGPAG